jgi:hypothetical protein
MRQRWETEDCDKEADMKQKRGQRCQLQPLGRLGHLAITESPPVRGCSRAPGRLTGS